MFARPTVTNLRDQAINDILIGTGLPALLRRSPLRAMAYGQAGLAQGQYGYLDGIAQQSTPFTATGVYLEAWGALVGINRLAARAATGSATLTGSGLVLAGTVLRRSDGASYVTQADRALAGSRVVALVAAVAVAAGTLDAGSVLTLASPVFGVTAAAIVSNGAPGADQETDQALRTRIIERWAAPPQGGSAADYDSWVRTVPGVTRVWVNPLGAGPGTVVLYTMFDLAEAAHGGFPQGSDGGAAAEPRIAAATGDQLAVANAIFPRRPVTALVTSVAPRPYSVDFVMHAQAVVPAAVQIAVQTAIDAAFVATSTPLNAELALSPFEAAIAGVPGMPTFTLLAPAAAITAPLGLLPVRGLVSYV